jgi:DNA repair protein REV1
MKEWIMEFASEGPYKEDVGALCKYLGKVVKEEKDLNKAVGVVKWLTWVVEDVGDEQEAEVDGERWEEALQRIKVAVTEAAKVRGMGAVSFE